MTWSSVLIAVGIFIHVCFLVALLKQDNSIMTFAWPLGLMLIAIVSFVYNNSTELGLVVLTGATLLWGIRLFLSTFSRNMRRGYEDFRYKQVRDSTESGFLIKSYLQFFVGQGVFMLLVGIPFVYANQGNYVTDLITLIPGLIIFAVGFIIETVADLQLSTFKKNNGKDAVLTTGVWSISRHPNYFGEILIWWGLGLIAFQINIWWVLVSPLLVTLLLRYVSGVPMLEERYDDNEVYQQYKSSTNPLFPLP